MKTLFYRFLLRKRLAAVQKTQKLLASMSTRKSIEAWQVSAFNKIWGTARCSVPLYQKWQKEFGLPDSIMSLAELSAWPVLTKADLRKIDLLTRSDVSIPKGHLITGGSTGEPVRLPAWEDPFTAIMQTIGRAAYGIQPGDKTLLLWGHEHLYGKGFARKINTIKRSIKDWLANWKRVSAYDLSEGAMKRAYGVAISFKPKFIIGFSPAVLSFVRHNKSQASKLESVEVVLCTAGPLTESEKKEISKFFGAKVCMEYGSVEGGCMAYTRPSDGFYNVHWNTHLIQAVKDSDGNYRNVLTRLTNCYVPIIRYDIGDCLELDEWQLKDSGNSVLEMKSILGRPSEMINFQCGVSFFGALIGDCVKQVRSVVASQIAVDEESDTLEIRVVANAPVEDNDKALILNRISLTVSNADKLKMSVVQVEKLFTTVGGKIPRIIRI